MHTWLIKCARKWRLEGFHLGKKQEEKRRGKKEDSSKPSSCPISKRIFGFFPNRNSNGHQEEEASSSFKEKRNEGEK